MIPNLAKIKILSATVLTAFFLSGCAAALISSAAAGTSSVIDRRTTGAQADDQIMEMRVKNTAISYLKQNNNLEGYNPNLSIVSYNRHILLLGKVATEDERRFVEQVARSEQSAQAVYNYIEIEYLCL